MNQQSLSQYNLKNSLLYKKFKALKNAIYKNDFVEYRKLVEDLSKNDLSESSSLLLAKLLEIGKYRFNNISSRFVGRYDRSPYLSAKTCFEGGRRLIRVNILNSNNKPLVTIITVVYNNVSTIEKCICSVLSQTYESIEYIIIDGASTDGTVDILKKYENQIDYIVSEPDNGIYNAMNRGLSLASGEYIAFLNADDFYLRDAVEISILNIIENNLQGSYAGFYYADENGVVVVADEPTEWDESILIQGIPGGHGTLFLHKNCYDYLRGYDEGYKLAADYHLFVRAFFSGFHIGPTNRNILVMLPGGASFKENVEVEENHRILKYCFPGLGEEFYDFLYEQKYYKHWYGYQVDHAKINYYLEKAAIYNSCLSKSLFLTIEQRKRGFQGKIKPAEKVRGDRLKICIVLNYLTNASGGAERIAIESANKLYEIGHAVTFVQCYGMAGEPYYRLNPEIPLIDLGVFPYKQEYLAPADAIDISFERFGGRIYNKLNFKPTKKDFEEWKNSPHFWRSQLYSGFFHHHQFDVVISHMPSSYPYVLLPRKENDNTLHIASLHNAPEFKFYSPLYPAETKMERYMRLVSLENADRIGVLFDAFVDQVPSCFQTKCFTLPNFLSEDIAFHANSFIKKRQDNSRVFLSIGRLSEQKDHETLIKAYAIAKERIPNWRLEIFGEGPLYEKLTQLCYKYNLDPLSVLKGSIKDIHQAYKKGDIFVFPSLFEGFGLTALEAMAFGLPVIAFGSCDGVKNLIKNDVNGWLIDDSNRVTNLANKLIEVASFGDDKIGKYRSGSVSKANEYSINSYVDALDAAIKIWRNTKEHLIPVILSKCKIRYAILTTYTDGGAGIAAKRLAQGLKNEGVDVSIFSFSEESPRHDFKMSLDQNNQKLYEKSLDIDRNHTKLGTTFFAEPRFPGLNSDQLSVLKNFDVINLHWVQFMLSVDSVACILSMGKKVIWTLHDMAPFTGGCHYSNGCLGYTNDCKNCPQLDQAKSQQPAEVLTEKMVKWNLENLTIVAPSRWLANCASYSAVFRNAKIQHIPNGLDTSVFVPTGKAHAKSYFGLPQDKKVLLFTCQSHGERRKGFKELLEVTKILASQRDDLHILTFGHASEEIENLPIPCTSLGHINEEWKIAVGYSAADVSILPSLEDNLPNVILESASCDTPIVSFDSGGCGDAVINGITGALIEKGNVKEMAKAVLNIIDNKLPCRGYAKVAYNLSTLGSNYKRLI